MTDDREQSPGHTDNVSRGLAVLTALAGLGSLVVFTGGAIVWVRYWQAHVPAEQAVAVTPNAALVAIGGAALGSFALIGAAAVLVAYAIDSKGTIEGNAVSATVLGVVGTLIAILLADASVGARRLAVAVTLVAGAVAIAVAVVTTHRGRVEWFERHAPSAAGLVALAMVGLAITAWIAFGEELAAGALGIVAVGVALVPVLARRPGARTVLLAAAGPLGVLVAAGAVGLILGAWWVAAVVGVAGLLIAAVLRVARLTQSRFRWFGAALFVAVLIFGAALNALRTWEEPRLQPMAVLFAGAAGGGQSGLFVSKTDTEVNLGVVRYCRRDNELVLRPDGAQAGTGEIVSLPRSAITAVSVGSVTGLRAALARAPGRLAELSKRVPAGRSSLPVAARPCAEEGPLDLTIRDAKALAPQEATRVAEAFRPVLRFDTREHWRPLNVDAVLGEQRGGRPAHALCDVTAGGAERNCEPLSGPEALAQNPTATIVNFAGKQLGGSDIRAPRIEDCPSAPPAIDLYDCDGGPTSAIYYRAVRANGRVYVDYWWFLRYNHFDRSSAADLCRQRLGRLVGCFDHEGDWEGITAISADGDATRLEFVDYAAHEGVFRHPVAELRREDGRPVVFVADGSHASYPAPCPRSCKQFNRLLGLTLPEDNTDGAKPWGRNAAAECRRPPRCLLPLPQDSWGAFPGFWGSRVCFVGTNARCLLGVPPRTPFAQRRFRHPWCYTGSDRRLTCDGKPPSG
jgi:hypothetical protein